MHSNSAGIEIAKPRLFTARAVIAVNAYGALLCLPVLAAFVAISLMRFSLLTVLIPLVVAGVTTFFLPFGFGNIHVKRLVESLHPGAAKDEDGFIVQLTLAPRIRSGLRAVLEDADDIGYLRISDDALVFEGDAVKLSAPLESIEQVQLRNIGLRGLYICGRRINAVVSGLPGVESLEFADRSSWLLPASRAVARKLHERLAAKAQARRGTVSA